jgi:RimJ/RimL family protein N-acetyltransferase
MADLVKLRCADERDLTFVTGLAADDAVEPYLSPFAGEPDGLRELLSAAPLGLFVIETAAGEPIGAVALHVVSERSRLCQLSRLMIVPRMRGAGIGSQVVRLACQLAFGQGGMHRVQAEVYGDNSISQRLFERVGFTREGVRRRAYWRRDRWLDGVMYGLLEEELRG